LASVGFTLVGRDARRRGLALAGLLSGLSLLLVLSSALSKLDWYVTPMIPLFSLAAAIGTVDALAWIDRAAPKLRLVVRVGFGLGLTAALVLVVMAIHTLRVTSHGDVDGPQFDYAPFFARLEAAQVAPSVIAVDTGFINAAGFKAYNPILKFYALRQSTRSLKVQVRTLDDALPMGALVVTCDPDAEDQLRDDYRLSSRLRDRTCVLGRIDGPAA
jgi:hypothetical protein